MKNGVYSLLFPRSKIEITALRFWDDNLNNTRQSTRQRNRLRGIDNSLVDSKK
jgi:hypothetical protein